MSAGIEQIQEKLHRRPNVCFKTGPTFLEVEPATSNGFRVWIQERVGGWTVGFEGWHDEFANPEVASRCFFFGFSPACRLRVFRRGSFDYKWQVLHRSEGNWLVESETSSLVFPFWRRPKTRELANNLSGLMS